MVNFDLHYHDHCKSESQQAVSKENEYKDKPELRRSQEIKNSQNNASQFLLHKNNQSDQILTFTYQHMTSNATISYTMRCESHQVETLSSNSRSLHMRGGGRLTLRHLFSSWFDISLLSYSIWGCVSSYNVPMPPRSCLSHTASLIWEVFVKFDKA